MTKELEDLLVKLACIVITAELKNDIYSKRASNIISIIGKNSNRLMDRIHEEI